MWNNVFAQHLAKSLHRVNSQNYTTPQTLHSWFAMERQKEWKMYTCWSDPPRHKGGSQTLHCCLNWPRAEIRRKSWMPIYSERFRISHWTKASLKLTQQQHIPFDQPCRAGEWRLKPFKCGSQITFCKGWAKLPKDYHFFSGYAVIFRFEHICCKDIVSPSAHLFSVKIRRGRKKKKLRKRIDSVFSSLTTPWDILLKNVFICEISRLTRASKYASTQHRPSTNKHVWLGPRHTHCTDAWRENSNIT